MNTKKLVTSAMLLALAAVLSLIQVFQLPFGGGITLASMMPVVLIACMYGTKHGLFCGAIYGFLQLLMGSSTVAAFFLPGESQMTVVAAIFVCLMDYILAYAVVGLGGVFARRIKNANFAVAAGAVFATGMRYVVHIISGAVFFGQWAEWFFGQDGFYAFGAYIMDNCDGWLLSLAYSVIYNGLYMLPEMVITAIVTPIIYNAVNKKYKIQ